MNGGARSLRGHPVCRDVSCDVEITPPQIYCEGHKWTIEKWLKRSRIELEIAKARFYGRAA